jgi:hypothetical protein
MSMNLDFWNNPILVTSVRRQFRGGRLLRLILLYPLILMLCGAAVPYFYPAPAGAQPADWPRYGFIALMFWQFGTCGLLATAAASHSLKSEVTNQTLDFLRLTSLSPRQILIGKLLGAVSLPFFVSVASFPVGVLCWTLGGAELHVLLLMYVNLFVYVLVSGSCGLVMRLELRDDKRVEANLMAVGGWCTGLACLGAMSLEEPLRTAALVFLPFPLLLLGYVNFHVMTRTLESPFNPALSKALAYVLALVLGVVAAVGANELFMITPGQRAVIYWSVMLAVVTYLIVGLTAWREVLRSWVWRFRGRVPRHQDEWLGSRSTNTSAVLTLVVIALFCYVLIFLPLAWLAYGNEGVIEEAPALVGTALLSTALLVAFGLIFQWASLIAGRNSQGLVLIFFFALLIPQVVGLIQDLPWLAQLSPYAHYTLWYQNPEKLPIMLPVLLAVFLLGALLAWRSHGSLMARMEQAIDRKLEKMGVLERGGEAAQRGEASSDAASSGA